MRHAVDGRKFGRNTSHRKAMFRNMANAVIEKEQIVTTLEKAKEVRRVVDRLITLGKSGSPASRRLAFDRTRSHSIVQKIFGTLATRYKQRPGGYTRVLKVADLRWGDAARMAVLELVDHPEIDRKRKPLPNKKNAKNQDSTEQTETQAKDPVGKFKKLFQPKNESGSKAKAGTAAKSVKKMPAGGGSSKMGGSS